MFRKIAEGNVCATDRDNWKASGSRVARLPDGKLICVFNTESASGVNDFAPVMAYSDDGLTWGKTLPLWPEWQDKVSMFLSVRNTDDGRISVCGMATKIDVPGENWWSDEESAMKQNQLVYAISDDGYTFPEPSFITLPYSGSCEIPGGMQVDADGTMHIVYSPYPTIGEKGKADTKCLVWLRSTDNGKTWEAAKIGCVDCDSLYAETWIGRLSTGAYMISTWQTASKEAPDQYLYSVDGKDFGDVKALPFLGQSTALTPWVDGKVLIVYNQRKAPQAGVWLCLAKPDENGFNMLENQPIWEAAQTTRSDSSGDFSQWTDFAFGEPHIIALNDGTFLAVFWYAQGDIKGIRYVKLAHEE